MRCSIRLLDGKKERKHMHLLKKKRGSMLALRKGVAGVIYRMGAVNKRL